jgi:Na+-driven multidrug efflux pump
MNENGVFSSIVIGETVLAVLGIWLFRKGKWKLKLSDTTSLCATPNITCCWELFFE